MTYWLILIPLCFFAFMMVLHAWKTGRIVTLHNLLLVWYCLSLLANIASGLYFDYRFSLAGILFYTFAVYLYVFPFRRLRSDDQHATFTVNYRRFAAAGVLIAVLSFVSIAVDLGNVAGAVDAEDINAQRKTVATDAAPYAAREIAALTLVAHFASALWFIALTMFFVALVKKYHAALTALLFVASFSNVIFHLTQAGRTGIVFWVCMFVANYLFFRPRMPARLARAAMGVFVGAGVVLVALLVIISSKRFSGFQYRTSAGATVSGPLTGALDYFGQSVVVFDEFIAADYSPYFMGAFIFPLGARTITYLAGAPSTLDDMYKSIEDSLPTLATSFGTFLRGLWYDFGPIGVLVVGVFFNLLVRRLCSSLDRRIDVRKVVLLMSLYCVPFLGIFSYPLSRMTDNFALLVVLLLRF